MPHGIYKLVGEQNSKKRSKTLIKPEMISWTNKHDDPLRNPQKQNSVKRKDNIYLKTLRLKKLKGKKTSFWKRKEKH